MATRNGHSSHGRCVGVCASARICRRFVCLPLTAMSRAVLNPNHTSSRERANPGARVAGDERVWAGLGWSLGSGRSRGCSCRHISCGGTRGRLRRCARRSPRGRPRRRPCRLLHHARFTAAEALNVWLHLVLIVATRNGHSSQDGRRTQCTNLLQEVCVLAMSPAVL